MRETTLHRTTSSSKDACALPSTRDLRKIWQADSYLKLVGDLQLESLRSVHKLHSLSGQIGVSHRGDAHVTPRRGDAPYEQHYLVKTLLRDSLLRFFYERLVHVSGTRGRLKHALSSIDLPKSVSCILRPRTQDRAD